MLEISTLLTGLDSLGAIPYTWQFELLAIVPGALVVREIPLSSIQCSHVIAATGSAWYRRRSKTFTRCIAEHPEQ